MPKEILQQKRGAALIYALMFFLFCALVGTIVVTAAAANAGKAAKMREEQQEYLAVRSAAQLVADMMSTGRFRGYYTVRDELIETTTDVGGVIVTVVDHHISFLGTPDPADPGHADRTGYQALGIECFPPELSRSMGNLYLQNASYGGVALLTRLDGADVSGDARYQVPPIIRAVFAVETQGIPPVTVTLEISKGGNGKLPAYSAMIKVVSASGKYMLTLDGLATTQENKVTTQVSSSVTVIGSTTDISWGTWTARKEVAS